MLTLPLHFAIMPIKELVPGTDRNTPLTNFNHLKPFETECGKAQIVPGCLLLMVQDSSALEEANLRQSAGYSENSARNFGNIFAPTSDTESSFSDYTSLSDDDHKG